MFNIFYILFVITDYKCVLNILLFDFTLREIYNTRPKYENNRFDVSLDLTKNAITLRGSQKLYFRKGKKIARGSTRKKILELQ